MKVKIRTKDIRLSIPVPVAMASLAVRLIPESMFEAMRANAPEPYGSLVTKENIGMLLTECTDILKENKGLEAVHVEAADGAFVSIRL